MKPKISVANAIIFISYYLIAIGVLFFRWYSNSNYPIYISTLSMVALTIIGIRQIKIKGSIVLHLFVIVAYLILNLLFTSQHHYIREELINEGIMTFSFALLIFYLVKSNSEFKNRFIYKPSFWLLNLYYIINSYIIIKQINNPGFMIRNFTNNSFYLDQIDGLLGSNGTHRLSLLCLAMLYLNYSFSKSDSKVYKSVSKFMLIFVFFSSCYFSVYNDNRMYYALLAVFIIPIIVLSLKNIVKKRSNAVISINKNKLLVSIISIIVILSSFLIVFMTNEKFNKFIVQDIYEQYIEKTYNKITSGSSNASQGEERLILFQYALNAGNGYSLGKGIGAITLMNDKTMPNHFGLNEMTSRVYNGGLLYVAILIYTYYAVYIGYFKRKNIKLKLYILVLLVIMAFYARIFTMPDETFLISLTFLYMAKSIGEVENE